MPSLNKLLAIASRGAAVLAAFILTAAVARLLPQDDAGRYFLITSTVTLLATVGRFGTDIALLKVAAARRTAGGVEFRRLLRIGLLCSTGTAVIGVGVLAALFWTDTRTPLGLLGIASTAVFAQAVSVMVGSVLRAIGHVATGAFAELGSIPFLTICGLLVASAVRPLSLEAVLVVYTAASWLTLVWATLWARAKTVQHSKRIADAQPAEPKPIRLTSLASITGTSVAYFATTWAPLIVLNASAGASAVALFTAAYRLASFISVFPTIQQSYLGPQFASLLADDEPNTLSRVAGRASLTALAISGLPVIAFFVAPGPILDLVMGANYSTASIVLVVLSIGALVATGMGQTSLLLLLSGREHFAAAANILVIVAWFTLGWAAAFYGGALGVAALSSTLTIAYAVLGTRLLIRKEGVKPFAYWWPAADTEK